MGNYLIIPFFRCSKILGEAGKQEILQQMFQKFQISNRLPNRYFLEIVIGCPWTMRRIRQFVINFCLLFYPQVANFLCKCTCNVKSKKLKQSTRNKGVNCSWKRDGQKDWSQWLYFSKQESAFSVDWVCFEKRGTNTNSV